MTTPASKIKRARTQAKLKQHEAAALTGIPLSSYQGYEQGKTMPPGDRLEHILAVLTGKKEGAPPTIAEEAPAYNNREPELAKTYREIGDRPLIILYSDGRPWIAFQPAEVDGKFILVGEQLDAAHVRHMTSAEVDADFAANLKVPGGAAGESAEDKT